MMGKRRHIGDRSAARIRLVFADDPERLATTVVAQNRDSRAERDRYRARRLGLQNRAREAVRERARIPRGQFQSPAALVGVLDRLRRFERSLAFAEGPLQRTEAGLGHKVGMRGNRPRRQAHLLCGLRALFPDKRNAHFGPPLKTPYIRRWRDSDWEQTPRDDAGLRSPYLVFAERLEPHSRKPETRRGDCLGGGQLSQGPHRQSAAASRDTDDGLRLRARALGRLAQAANLSHLDLRFRERSARQGFFRPYIGSPSAAPGREIGSGLFALQQSQPRNP